MRDKPSPDLVDLMRALRERAGMSMGDVERCMKLPKDTYRHIERGRRPLPDFQHGLIPWLRSFLVCIGASPEEQGQALRLAAHDFVEQIAEWMVELKKYDVDL